MTTFHPIVLDCPHCSTLMSDYELMSYTVHSSTNWSDGKCDNGMPDSKEILICVVCHQPFWKKDAKLPEDPDWNVVDDLAGANDIYDLPWRLDGDWQEKQIDFYKDLLEDGFANEDWKELYLRTKLWWIMNDLARNLPSYRSVRTIKRFRVVIKHRRESLLLYKKYKPFFDQNLAKLIFFYIKSGDVDLLYLADMYREKRDFKKAMEILLKVEQKGAIFNQMKHKIRRKNSRVFQLK